MAVPNPGDNVALAEHDYKYGVGDIIFVVVSVVGEVFKDEDDAWVCLNGHEVRGDWTGRERTITARVRGIAVIK